MAKGERYRVSAIAGTVDYVNGSRIIDLGSKLARDKGELASIEAQVSQALLGLSQAVWPEVIIASGAHLAIIQVAIVGDQGFASVHSNQYAMGAKDGHAALKQVLDANFKTMGFSAN